MDITMQRYADFAPTGFDRRGAFLTDFQNCYVAMVKFDHDADCLTESNWEMFKEGLLGEEGQTDHEDDPEWDWFIARFGHWASSFEVIIVNPDSPSAERAQEMLDALSYYPVLSDSDYSEREYDRVMQAWEDMSEDERDDYTNEGTLDMEENWEEIYNAIREDYC